MKIDIVSDVSCPWCLVGIKALEQALANLDGAVQADVTYQPYELNPDLPPGGENFAELMAARYGADPTRLNQAHATLVERGAALGFRFDFARRERMYNTFDAHRLLHWAGLEGRQRALKMALFSAYFTNGEDIAAHAVLQRLAVDSGLDAAGAAAVLASDAYAAEVRERERFYQQQGINSVPAIIINDRHLISGGQPVEVFEQALRQIAAEAPGN